MGSIFPGRWAGGDPGDRVRRGRSQFLVLANRGVKPPDAVPAQPVAYFAEKREGRLGRLSDLAQHPGLLWPDLVRMQRSHQAWQEVLRIGGDPPPRVGSRESVVVAAIGRQGGTYLRNRCPRRRP